MGLQVPGAGTTVVGTSKAVSKKLEEIGKKVPKVQ